MLLIFTFIILFLLVFIVLAFASKPTRHQKTIDIRLAQLDLAIYEKAPQKSDEILKQGPESAFPWFDQLLSRSRFYEPLRKLIEQADSKSSPGKVVAMSLALGGLAFFSASFFAPILVRAVAAAIAATPPILILRFKRTSRLKAFNEALPDAIDMMARALRAGHSVASAIEIVAEQAREPVASEFGKVYQQQNFGLPFRDALTAMASRIDSKDLQFVVTAMLVQKETGGNLAEILDRTTHVIRERLRIYGEIRIKSAQGRLTGWILSLLPIVIGVLINLVNHGFEKPLLEDRVGNIMLYAGAGMLTVGALIIRKIVDIEV